MVPPRGAQRSLVEGNSSDLLWKIVQQAHHLCLLKLNWAMSRWQLEQHLKRAQIPCHKKKFLNVAPDKRGSNPLWFITNLLESQRMYPTVIVHPRCWRCHGLASALKINNTNLITGCRVGSDARIFKVRIVLFFRTLHKIYFFRYISDWWN